MNAAGFVRDVLSEIAQQYKNDLAAGAERGPLAGVARAVTEAPTRALDTVSKAVREGLSGTADGLQQRTARLRTEQQRLLDGGTRRAAVDERPDSGGWAAGSAAQPAGGTKPKRAARAAADLVVDVTAVSARSADDAHDAQASTHEAALSAPSNNASALVAGAQVAQRDADAIVVVTATTLAPAEAGAATAAPGGWWRPTGDSLVGVGARQGGAGETGVDAPSPSDGADGEADDEGFDVDVTAVADAGETRSARQAQLVADKLALWLERSVALTAEQAADLFVPEQLASWRTLKRFRRPPPPEFPGALVAELLSSLISRE